MKFSLFFLIISCMLDLSAFSVNSKKDEGPVNNSQNDTLVLTSISKDLYICTCKPNTANPNGEGKIYYQGRFNKDEVTEDADYTNCDERFLMQWDLAELPKGIKIIEAKMQLVCTAYNGDQQGQLVYECISEPWNTDIGYSHKPKTLPETRVKTNWPIKNTYHIVDITSIVMSWYNGSLPNHGLMGFSIDTETTNSAIFCSSKFPQENVRPKLIVIFSKF